MQNDLQPKRLRAGFFVIPILAAATAAVAGCGAVAKYAVDHTLGARLGPCGEVQDSVRAADGDPWRTFVGDEEDVDTGEQNFEHEWGYRIRDDATGEFRSDSVRVVRFRWGVDYRGCEADERFARRPGRMGTPWEEAEEP